MPDEHDALKVALRVLNAIRDCRQPGARDVDLLRRLTPANTNAPVDECACDVVVQALKTRGHNCLDNDSPISR
jgi:hypothetical protein